MTRAPGVVATVVLLGALLAAASGSSARSGRQTPSPPAPPVVITPPPPNVCDNGALHLRCPDLVMSAPFDLEFDRHTYPGHVLLRASSSINNHGAGPLELRGHRARGAGFMRVSQIIYRSNGRRLVVPTKARLGFKFVSGNRYGFATGNASYWKYRGAARFMLWQLNKRNQPIKRVRTGPKLFYCFRDLDHTRSSRRSPKSAHYPACSQNRYQRKDTLGTSVGWSDVYPYSYPEQYVDVTGLRGRFAYVQLADPFNNIAESNERNNISEVILQLPSGRVLHRRTGVSLP
ncbi:MAG TPA: lysyl oxidase family protein [Thermoleophilaceae bacterium]